MRLLPLALLFPLAACGYAPPPQTDTASAPYQTAFDACSASVPDAVDRHNAKTGLAWMAGGITRWSAIDTGMNACMAGKGWGHLRPCTPDELHHGNTTPGLTVTAAGIRCSAPPTTAANKSPA